MSTNPIELARAEAQSARNQLVATLGELQQRLSPGHVASEAWKEARALVDNVAVDAARIATKRPAVSVAIAGTALAVLVRGVLWPAISHRILKRNATRKDDAGLAETKEEPTQ